MARLLGIGVACLTLVLSAAGCMRRLPDPPLRAGEPLSLQMLRTESQLRQYPFRTLLEFEAPTDRVFVRLGGAPPRLDSSRSHTGTHSLLLDRGCKSMSVRLPILFTSPFPGRWALAGAYFYASKPQRLAAAYEVEGTPLTSIHVELPAGQWMPVLLDVASAADGKNTPTGILRFTFSNGLTSSVWCDDVLVMDNTKTLVDSRSSPDGNGWLVQERGFQITLHQPNLFTLAVQTPEASSQGWILREANEIRVCFSSPDQQHTRVVYCGGLQIIDGKLIPPSSSINPALLQQHSTPAEITIAPEMGRLDRNSPGDANNDGYAERTGAYQIIASGPRLELTVTPQSSALAWPVLEIANLPPGQILAHMEGRSIERIVRLDNGHVLVTLPGTLTRATMLSLRVAQ